ncbi:MAG: hypothetical protein GY798_04775 [Hyphomicrobiales bacterium]|nr:hypothetical protein [Hyphomicrobiales bacterium]
MRAISTLLYHRKHAYDDLAALAEVPELAESWRSLARRRVEKRGIEDWTPRLRRPDRDRSLRSGDLVARDEVAIRLDPEAGA